MPRDYGSIFQTYGEVAKGSVYRGSGPSKQLKDKGRSSSTETRVTQHETRTTHESRPTHRPRHSKNERQTTFRPTESGPAPLKPATFDGKKDWRPFFLYYERMAKRYGWSDEVKLDRLVESLRDKALQYYSTLRESEEVRKLQNLKQLEGESLEELAERAQQLTLDGYPGADDLFMESLAIEAFLKATSHKDAAMLVMSTKPTSLEDALEQLNINVHSQEILFGPHRSKVRQLFQEEPPQVRATYPAKPKVSWSDKQGTPEDQCSKKLEGILKDNQTAIKNIVEANQQFWPHY